jgi:hypothetical protein
MAMPRCSLGALLTVAIVSLAPAGARAEGPAAVGAPMAAAPAPAAAGDDGPPPPPPSSSAGPALATGGTILAGLGGATLLAASIAWLTAAGDAAKLDDECPNKVCVEGTPGGDALVEARDAERAAGVLVGVGTPLLAGGLVLTLFSTAFGSRGGPVRVVPSVGLDFAGGTLQGRF